MTIETIEDSGCISTTSTIMLKYYTKWEEERLNDTLSKQNDTSKRFLVSLLPQKVGPWIQLLRKCNSTYTLNNLFHVISKSIETLSPLTPPSR